MSSRGKVTILHMTRNDNSQVLQSTAGNLAYEASLAYAMIK